MTTQDTPPANGNDPLLAAHYLPVMRLCLSRLHDPADAEDATQEVFRRALQHATRLRDDPLPWLITVAKNVCNDELRRRRRLAGLTCGDEPAALVGDATPEGMVVGRMAVMELLGRLTPGERRAMTARLANGVGDGSPTSTTRVLLARARVKLRQYLEESQSAFGTATVYGAGAVHRLRSRLMFGSGRAAMVVPAVLILTVAGSHVTGAPAIGGAPGASGAPVSLAPNDTAWTHHETPEDSPGSTTAVSRIGTPSLQSVVPAAPDGNAALQLPPPAGPTWYTSVQQQDYRQVWTADIEPSPTYSSDHTVLMIGPNHQCDMLTCSQIFRSGDGGATWSFLTGQAPTGVQLVLPWRSFGAGHFYAAGLSGVEVTRDNGVTFATVLPNSSGTAMVPPASSGLDMVYSGDYALWGVPHQGPPTLLSAFNGGDNASGTPLLLNTATGYVVLQPVSPPTSMPGTPTYLERCSPQCGPDTPLPLRETHPRFVASPDVATDHTVYELGGTQLGVSHDDGLTFTVVTAPGVNDMIAVSGPAGRRLVGTIGDAGALGYSDDDGTTWHMAAGPNAALTNAQTLTQLRPGRLIASMMRSDDWGWHYFVCSRDGAVWTACSPDKG